MEDPTVARGLEDAAVRQVVSRSTTASARRDDVLGCAALMEGRATTNMYLIKISS